MLGFRTNTPWKSMLAAIYYSLCFLGFRYGVAVGVVVLILGVTTPTLLATIINSIRKRNPKQLLAIPAWILAVSMVILIYTFRDKIDTKNVPAKSVVGTREVLTEPDDFFEEVYITRSGAKYHKKDCQMIDDVEVVGITLREALESYKSPCSKCYD